MLIALSTNATIVWVAGIFAFTAAMIVSVKNPRPKP